MIKHPLLFNLFNAGLFQVDVSTEVRHCWNSRCMLHEISQQPIMIEQSFNFFSTLPWADEYVSDIGLFLT